MAERKKSIPGYMHFVIGGLSGMMSICIVQPADLTKTRMQLMGKNAKNIGALGVVSDIVKREGVLGLYTGLSAALFRQATYTTARLGIFNMLFDLYKNTYGGPPSFGTKMLMGISAGGIAAFVGNPPEVCLIRMTADGTLPPEQRRNYKHVFDAFGRIIREEGVTTLWRGTMAAVSRAVVVNGTQLSTYSQAKELLLSTTGEGLLLNFCSSMISACVSSFVSMPLDIVKTRIQNSEKGASQIGVFLSVIKKEGPLKLWSGFLPTFGKIGPHTIFTFIFFEQLKSLYRRLA